MSAQTSLAFWWRSGPSVPPHRGQALPTGTVSAWQLKRSLQTLLRSKPNKEGALAIPWRHWHRVTVELGMMDLVWQEDQRSRGITSSCVAHLRNSVGFEALSSILLDLVAEESWGLSVLCFSFRELSLPAALPVFGWPSAELPFTFGALA